MKDIFKLNLNDYHVKHLISKISRESDENTERYFIMIPN